MSKTHDYSIKEWGHNYQITSYEDDGHKLRMAGWGYGIKDGDFLIVKNGDGTTRYKIDSISYQSDPPDMWFASTTFAPRDEVDRNGS